MSRASAVARIRDAPADLISDSEKARIMTWLQTIPSEERDDYIPTDVNGKSTDYYTRLGVAEGEGHTAGTFVWFISQCPYSAPGISLVGASLFQGARPRVQVVVSNLRARPSFGS